MASDGKAEKREGEEERERVLTSSISALGWRFWEAIVSVLYYFFYWSPHPLL